MALYHKSIEVLAKLPWYTEGPVADGAGNIFFTTLKGGKILKMDANYRVAEWADSPCPNGQLILSNGDHLVCDAVLATISRFNSEGKFIRHDIQKSCAGEKISSPNDLVADAKGGIYFTDSVREKGKVCFYAPGGMERVVVSDLDFPNGIALNKDGSTILVAESYRNRILSVDSLSGKYEVFAELPVHQSGEMIKNLPDGIQLDSNGNLLVAHYGMQAVQVLSSEGKLLDSIHTEFPLTSNLFIQNNILFVTGGYDEPGPGGLIKIVME